MEERPYLSLTEAANNCPGKPHVSCLWRWCRRGVQARSGERIRLEHRRLGGKIFTRLDWLEDFSRRLAEADAKYFDLTEQRQSAVIAVAPRHRRRNQPPRRSAEHASFRDQQDIAAEKELDDAGVR